MNGTVSHMDSAEASHAWMCRSVPQIPARSTRTVTSHGPHSGSGTSVSVRPGPGSVLSSARIIAVVVLLDGWRADRQRTSRPRTCSCDHCDSRDGPGGAMGATALAYPFTGRWQVRNSPADRVPSHGTRSFGLAHAIDFVPVTADGRTAPYTVTSLLRP